MTNFKQKLLIYFASISSCTLLISNIAAVKLWDFFGIAVDGGVVLFPLTYIIGDLIVEFYGKKIAKNIIFAGFFMNLIACAIFYIVIALPAYDGWKMQDSFFDVLGFAPRIILGSLLAYVCSNLVNNVVFTKLKHGNGIFASSFIARALGSSAFAHILDSAIFETIAFLGVLSFQEFVMQAVFAYVLGIGLEVILSPIEIVIAKKVKHKIEEGSLIV